MKKESITKESTEFMNIETIRKQLDELDSLLNGGAGKIATAGHESTMARQQSTKSVNKILSNIQDNMSDFEKIQNDNKSVNQALFSISNALNTTFNLDDFFKTHRSTPERNHDDQDNNHLRPGSAPSRSQHTFRDVG